MKRILFTFLIVLSGTFAFSQCYPDRHNTSIDESWISCQAQINPNPARGEGHWIMYDFRANYRLGQSHFWNLNAVDQTASGIKNAIIDYSLDGIEWQELGAMELQQADASGFYEGEDGPFFAIMEVIAMALAK